MFITEAVPAAALKGQECSFLGGIDALSCHLAKLGEKASVFV